MPSGISHFCIDFFVLYQVASLEMSKLARAAERLDKVDKDRRISLLFGCLFTIIADNRMPIVPWFALAGGLAKRVCHATSQDASHCHHQVWKGEAV